MAYAPDRGDIIWVDFDPTKGHEQSGHRPALVISPKVYNDTVGLALVCPMTTKVKGYPMEVEIASNPIASVTSVVLSDQVTSIDWRARNVTYKGKATATEVAQVLARINVLLK